MNTIDLLYSYEILVQDENVKNDYIKNLFDEEGAFGEADCAGL